MRSLSILALTLALGSALNVEAEKFNSKPCIGFDGCDLGETSLQDFMDDAANEDGAVSITCWQLNKVWKRTCGDKINPWDLTNQCMIADLNNDASLDATEL